MALHSFRLRRALSLSSFLIHHSAHQPKPLCAIPSLSHLLPAASPSSSTNAFSHLSRPFTSTTSLLMSSRGKVFDPNTDEIGPDTILFEGCDYNHWLITVDFPKDSELSREQMIETYVNIAAQIFGSVEEAKKKIYALSTTTYKGFQVECSEETSEKFKSIPGVVFVLPDSYIDPVNKEYGGDKYVNGEIFPRPPPVHYGRQYNRNRRQRGQQEYGPPQQQSYRPPPPQNFSAPQQHNQPSPQSNYPPQMQQNYRQPSQQAYQPPPQQTYQSSPQNNYQSSSQQYNQSPQSPPRPNYPPSPQQNYEPQPWQRYGQPSQQTYPPPPQQHQGQPPHQSYGQTPQQHHGQPPQQNYGAPPNFNQRDPANYHAQQGNTQRHVQPENRGFSQDSDYGSPVDGDFGPGGRRNF